MVDTGLGRGLDGWRVFDVSRAQKGPKENGESRILRTPTLGLYSLGHKNAFYVQGRASWSLRAS